jgi:hypothetical protein
MTTAAPTALDLQKVARLRLAPVGETAKFPSRAPFFKVRLSSRAAVRAAGAEENERGNLPVSPFAPSPALEVTE